MRPLVRADLHVHSNASDGTDPPAEVMCRAAAAGLDVVALTDHDTVAGHAEARAAAGQVTLLPGMELSARLDDRSVHMLAYLFDPANAELAAQCERIRTDRVRRAKAIVSRLAELGTGVTWEQVTEMADGGVVGRPHIARALAAEGVIDEPSLAFTEEWIGMGGRAYVGRYALEPARAIALIRAAGGVAVLAHPRAGRDSWMIPDEVIAGLAGSGLAGVEVWHPDHDSSERTRLRHLADELGLVPSGGSDDHGTLTGHRVGCEVITPESYQRLVERSSGAVPVGS